MKAKIFFIVCIVLAVILSANNVCAMDNGTDEISLDDSSALADVGYDKTVDHRPELESYRTVYTPFEVEQNETFVKNIGLTRIEIKNTDDERSYHEMTYTYKNGVKVIDDEWSCPLNLGAKNVNREGLIVCHVLLHGTEIVKEKEPVYKTVKVNKKVFSHYKKVKKASYVFKEATGKKFNVVKDLKRRIVEWETECCSKTIWKIVDRINYNGYAYKIQVLKKYKNQKRSSMQMGGWSYPVKLKVTLYKKVPVYKTVKVNKKECTGYKVLNVLHVY